MKKPSSRVSHSNSLKPQNPQKKGYRTLELPYAFWESAKFQIPFNSKTRRYRIFLVFISSNVDEERNKSYLALKDTSLGKLTIISST
jgi:hypothetical protein